MLKRPGAPSYKCVGIPTKLEPTTSRLRLGVILFHHIYSNPFFIIHHGITCTTAETGIQWSFQDSKVPLWLRAMSPAPPQMRW